MAKHKKRRKLPKPNPYLLMTGAVAASAAALTMQGGQDAEANHSGTIFRMGTNDGGKMYSDIEAGQCAAGEYICYMTMTLSDDSGIGAPYVANAVSAWNSTPTTLWYNQVPQDTGNDVQIKKVENPATPNAILTVKAGDFHFWQTMNYCPGDADCHDPDGNPAHQPERWWYSFIWLDPESFLAQCPLYCLTPRTAQQRTNFVELALGLSAGLRDRPGFDGCVVPSIMDVDCLGATLDNLGFTLFPQTVFAPMPVDVCSVNHPGGPLGSGWNPLMYGDVTGNPYRLIEARNAQGTLIPCRSSYGPVP